MTHTKQIFTILIFSMALTMNMQAVPADPKPFTVRQPDGTELVLRRCGDEYFNYYSTIDGVPVRQNEAGEWVGYEVDIREFAAEQHAERILQRNVAVQPRSIEVAGTIKALVILVNFADKSFVVPAPQQSFYNLLNQAGYNANGATGSARDYFISNSNGLFTPQFDVVGPYTLPNDMEYYGGNNSAGNDMRATQMVLSACSLAYAAGVDFTQYDSNHDGRVDQIFIYYAGNNEAEGGPANSIWPHRYQVSGSVGSMRLGDYACASELRGTGTSAANMCGIGTFVHEFGHILGLPDFYDPSYGGHHTLDKWDVMDGGCYLNNGRTPAGYSGYERFFLGWLTPRVINQAENAVLDTLTHSNEALMVSQTGVSNLNGANPIPRLFYMLENRQKKGWDLYLPAHGMLITKINYSAAAWASNTVNSVASDMRVDIIEADGIANTSTLTGDPFPGTSRVRTYNIVFESDNTKSLTEITETNGIISFKFMGGTAASAEALHQTPLQITVANHKLQITNYELKENETVQIFDLTGKNVTALHAMPLPHHSPLEIDISALPAGIYILKAGNEVRKFVNQ